MTKRFHKVEARREAAQADALDAAAAELERQAEQLRSHAGRSRDMATTHDRWARLPDVMREIETAMLGGLGEAEAIAKAVDGYLYVHNEEADGPRAREVLALHFGAHFRAHIAENGQVRRFIRNREILRLAHTNSNDMIAHRMKLHPKSISRIVQQCLRESRPKPDAATVKFDRQELLTRELANEI